MPRFHFNVFDQIDAMDEEGRDHPSLECAKITAIEGAREMIAERIRTGKPVYSTHRLEITNDRGAVLHAFRFGDIVDFRA